MCRDIVLSRALELARREFYIVTMLALQSRKGIFLQTRKSALAIRGATGLG